MSKTKKKKKKIKKTPFVLLFFIIIVILGIAFLSNRKAESKKEDSKKSNSQVDEKVKEPVVKKLQIVDEDSDTRNVAVMYNNISDVWDLQAGLQDAYIVYELLVEGGYTRLMAIFKDKLPDRIGSVRSSRPYYLDYVLENDAIYVHFGGSEQAYSQIKSLGINHIDGMTSSGGFFRDTSLRNTTTGQKVASEHTAFTDADRIQKEIKKNNFRTTTKNGLLLNYSVDEIDLSKKEDAIPANKVYIKYSYSRSTTFEYDSVNKVYLRSQGTAKSDYAHVDAVTKKQYTAKNIITYQIPTHSIDNKGRQEMQTTGGGKGYYITDGFAVPITWEKTSRSAPTIYRYMDGTEIDVNDGNTYIQIQPSGQTITIQ